MLKNTDFSCANLTDVQFSNAVLVNSIFLLSNLSNANFSNVDLSQTTFEDIFYCGNRLSGKITSSSVLDILISEQEQDNTYILQNLSCN